MANLSSQAMQLQQVIWYKCTACDWCAPEAQIDRVADPKPGSTAVWSICPQCRAAEQFVNACDEPGCSDVATVGENTEQGYRRRCFRHSDFSKQGRLR